MKYEMSKVSMKMYAKNFIMVLLALVFGVMLRAVPTEAATLEKVVTGKTGTVSFNRELTGDGVTEKVSITALKADGNKYWYDRMTVSVNGKNAATLKPHYYFDSFDIQYISMSNTKKFLVITAVDTSDYYPMLNAIYRYDSGKKKLIQVLDFTLGRVQSIKKVSSNSIIIYNSTQFPETGYVDWNFVYVYKNGKFKLKSTQAKVKSGVGLMKIGDGYDNYFKKNQFKAAKTLTFYTSTKLSKKAYTAHKGDVLTLKKICVLGKKIYLCFSRNGKKGWIQVNNRHESVYGNNSYNGWFYGTGRRLAG